MWISTYWWHRKIMLKSRNRPLTNLWLFGCSSHAVQKCHKGWTKMTRLYNYLLRLQNKLHYYCAVCWGSMHYGMGMFCFVCDETFSFHFFHHKIMKLPWLSPYFKPSVYSCWLLCTKLTYTAFPIQIHSTGTSFTGIPVMEKEK